MGTYKNSHNTPHWHRDAELIYVERGALEVVCDGETYAICSGDTMFIDGESLHCIHATDPSSLLKTVIFDTAIISDYAETLALEKPVLSRDYGVGALYKKLFFELTKKPKLYSFSTAAAVSTVMLEIFRGEKTIQKKIAKADIQLKALFSEIEAHFDTYTLNDAAEFMGMNASYLSRFFTKRTGMHFMRYVNCVRVEKAVELLRGGERSVTEIAGLCGFGTIRSFNGVFKQLTGYSPSALPAFYTFSAISPREDSPSVNPTLFDCELVECSSVR